MPWHIETDNPGCTGFAVVKDENGELEGCHRNRTQAEAQLAALYAAEADQEDRAGTGPRAIITDIDGTLVSDAGRNQALISYLDESDAVILVVTGRLNDRREETARLLDTIGLDYDELYMSAGGDPNAHKKVTAERLLESFTITEAYDDNPDARAAYDSVGITGKAPRSNRAIAEAILAKFTQVR